MAVIIAEAGTGFASSNPRLRLKRARALTLLAAQAGADCVKFQLFVPDEELFCPKNDAHRWARWSETFLTLDEWFQLRNFAHAHDIDFMASAFQRTGVKWLGELKPSYYKVASRAAKTYPYDLVPGPFIISTGLGPVLDSIDQAKKRVFLDCVMKYPTPIAEARWGGRRAGLSDHSGTVFPGLDAIFRGAKFLEVHFKGAGLDPGPDLPVCLTVDQLKLLCEARDAVAQMRPR